MTFARISASVTNGNRSVGMLSLIGITPGRSLSCRLRVGACQGRSAGRSLRALLALAFYGVALAGGGLGQRPGSRLSLPDVLVGVVAAAYQGPGRHMLEPQLVRRIFQRLEL